MGIIFKLTSEPAKKIESESNSSHSIVIQLSFASPIFDSTGINDGEAE